MGNAGWDESQSFGKVLHKLQHLLPDALVPVVCREKILEYVRSIPVVVCPTAFGFETQLSAADSPVDFAFCISTAERDVLNWWIKGQGSKAVRLSDPWWQAIVQLCSQWGDEHTLLFNEIRNLWLEYKAVREASCSLPHIFIGLAEKPGKDWDADLFRIIKSIKQQLPSYRQTQAICACLAHIPGDGRLFQIGLSPRSPVLRLCFKFHVAGQAAAFLDNLGLADYSLYTIPFLEDFRSHLHSFCVHLDVDDNLLPQAGIELHIASDPLQESVQENWEPVLKLLVLKKLCLESKSTALLKWCSCSYEDLAPSLDRLLTYRFLYYLKAVFKPGLQPSVKAYFGFINRDAAFKPVYSKTVSVPVKHSTLRQAVARGISWLKSVQLPQGEFITYRAPSRDMEYFRYDGSPFVTGCLLYNLRYLPESVLGGIRKKAGEFLLDMARKEFLWCYWTPGSGKTIDPDLDDTCLISFVLQHDLGVVDVMQNRDLILANRNQNGLFYTWVRPGCVRNDVDAVVNANALLYLGEDSRCRSAVKYIKDCIRIGWEAGSYWYYLNDLSLYYALSRAYANGITAFEEIAEPVIEKILVKQQQNGAFNTPLQTALALCSLCNFNYPQDKKTGSACDFLLSQQAAPGYWSKEAFYCGPEPPDRYVWFGSRELTTGFCLEALSRFIQ